MDKIRIGHTENTGRGLFANTKFKKNQILFVVEGKIRVEPYGPNYWIGARWFGIGHHKWVITSKDSYAYYLNHSCEPNAGLKDGVVVVAMRNIERGDEITLDYSITEADPYWRMKCSCGSENCRKIIRGIQFLPQKVIRKYGPFVPEFFRAVRAKISDRVQ